MNLYKSLAKVYHQMYQNLFDYEAEYEFYAQKLHEKNIKNLIEFGCGTGNLAQKFIANHFDYQGVDLNIEMLEIAKETLPERFFRQADMRLFETEKKTDAAIITGRTISYLIENQDVINALGVVNKTLNKNGILIFDAIDAHQMFVDFDSETKILDANGYQRISSSSPNLKTGWTWNWQADYFIKQGSDLQFIGNDETVLRAFTDDEIVLFLEMTGFQLLEIIPKATYTWNDRYFMAQKNQ